MSYLFPSPSVGGRIIESCHLRVGDNKRAQGQGPSTETLRKTPERQVGVSCASDSLSLEILLTLARLGPGSSRQYLDRGS